MKWYASWGHDEFILCLGYSAEIIKEYFLHYNEALANDFVLSNGGREVELLGSDISDWRITFVDTGAQVDDRRAAARGATAIGDDEMFLATYGDGLTDAPLDEMIERLVLSGKTGLFMSVRPRLELPRRRRRRGRHRHARSRTSTQATFGSTAVSSFSAVTIFDD